MLGQGKYQRPGGALVRTSGDELRVWLISGSPVLTAGVAFVVGGFLAWWLVSPGSVTGLAIVLVLALAAAVWGFVYQRKCDRRRTPDLVFDAARGQLTRLRPPPPVATTRDGWNKRMMAWSRGVHPAVVMSFETIRAIEVVTEHVVEKDSEGDDVKSTYAHVIAKIVAPTGTASECALATMTQERDANAFAAWVRSTLGLA